MSAMTPTKTFARMRSALSPIARMHAALSPIVRMRATLPPLTRATRMSRGEVTIWVLSAGLVAAGIALLSSGAVSARPVVPSMQVSAWSWIVNLPSLYAVIN